MAEVQSSGATSDKTLERRVQKHLQHFKDPYTIAEQVQRLLDKNNFEEAALLTRTASRNAKVTVSWNHLINSQMENQRLHSAIKLYNEMKKRAQLPDAVTYTIIFRGCAKSNHPKLAAAEAMRIYNTMLASDRLRPNTIHLNAVLETCARAGDIDSMFAIAKTADDSSRSADSRTYTIILKGLRHNSFQGQRILNQLDSSLSPEEIEHDTREMIRRASALWDEVIRRWNKGQIVLDETLVCSMGRILLMGNRADCQGVLPLVEQTMNIPRLDINPIAPREAEDRAESEGEPSTAKKSPPQVSGSLSKPTGNRAVGRKLGYADPGPNTLSLLMTSLSSTRNTTAGPRYWKYLVKQRNVQPDAENWQRLMFLYLVGKASSKAASALALMPKQYVSKHSIRLALKTCVADHLNRNAYQNACAALKIMTSSMKIPDAFSLRLFLRAARGNYSKFNTLAETNPQAAKMALGTQIVSAVDRLWDPLKALNASFKYSGVDTGLDQIRRKLLESEKEESMAVARRMAAAMDKVITEEMASPEIIKVLKARQIILRRYLNTYYDKAAQVRLAKGEIKRVNRKDVGRREQSLES